MTFAHDLELRRAIAQNPDPCLRRVLRKSALSTFPA